MLTTFVCSSCSAPVRRLPGSSDKAVLCPACTESGVGALRAIVNASAVDVLDGQLAKFDGAGSYRSAQLSTDPTSRWERAAVDAVAAQKSAWEQGTVGRGGLILIGPAGIGKTWAGIAICRAVGAFDPTGVLALSETELLAPGIAPWELTSHIRRLIAGRRCILVDDVGAVARPADQVMSAWKFLLDSIRSADYPTLLIVTTNRQSWSGPNGLADWMGAQAVSRLREHADIGTTGWTDRRTGLDHDQWKAHLMPGR